MDEKLQSEQLISLLLRLQKGKRKKKQYVLFVKRATLVLKPYVVIITVGVFKKYWKKSGRISQVYVYSGINIS